MKKAIALLLVLTTLLSLAACGGSTPAETSAPAAVEAPTEAPTTEPPLSPEEILYNSLTDRQKQAVDLGIVELSQMEDLERPCTVEEAIQMLQNAYTQYYGRESHFLTDAMNVSYRNESVVKGWIARYPAALAVEALAGENFVDHTQWLTFSSQWLTEGYLWNPLHKNQIYTLNEEKTEIIPLFTPGDNYMEFECVPEMKAEISEDQFPLYEHTLQMYDRTTGKKLVELDEENLLHPEQEMTLAEVAELSLRVYHGLPEEMELVAYEEVGSYDPSIITPELLAKETTLPDATCESLPAWHGILVDDLNRVSDYGEVTIYTWGHFDDEICEYDIQTIKEAGFDFIGLQVPFLWLQAGNPVLRPEAPDGQVDENRLRKLDQILAWCMEWDIHLDIRCTNRGDGARVYEEPSVKDAEDFTAIWKALARRYADIPNQYLSFTLFDISEGTASFYGNEANATEYFAPAVAAIREESPERCIIADVSLWRATGKEMAKLGVALSFDCEGAGDKNGFTQIGMKQNNNAYMAKLEWPHKGLDAQSMLNAAMGSGGKGKVSLLEIAEVAKENNLGFMVSGWGPSFIEFTAPNYGTASMRYPDETYHAFIQDMASAMDERGFGWCFTRWNGAYGLAYAAPLVQNVTYQQIEDYPMYIDTAMYSWFQEINGVR